MANHQYKLGIDPIGSELGASNLGFQLLQSWLSRNLHLRTSLLISIDCLFVHPLTGFHREASEGCFKSVIGRTYFPR